MTRAFGHCAGVLALQGDVEPHVRSLRAASGAAAVRRVRKASDLERVTHLVLPGGESMTLARLLRLFGLGDAIIERYRAGTLSLLGTCAGTILLANELGLLDIDVERNAYGAQLDSFSTRLSLDLSSGDDGGRHEMEGVFIRAPRITRVGRSVRVLATVRGDAVLVEADRIIAATFHPELTNDPTLHERFLRTGSRHRGALHDQANI